MNEYDETFGNKRPLNVALLVKMAQDIQREYEETALYSVGPNEAHIEVSGLLQIAPTSEWEWSDRDCSTITHWATVMIDGVTFRAIFTDEEKEAALNG